MATMPTARENGFLQTGTRPWSLLIALALLWLAPMVSAQQPHLKPHDFKPLTELPWDDPAKSDATVVIERIFLEPDFYIRHSVLKSYLERVPLDQFGKAFDTAIRLEGSHLPDRLVSRMLKIWAKRDPESALERVGQLFDIVGIEGWLGHASWSEGRVYEVQNHEAIQKSHFWIERDTLSSFAYGAELSNLESEKKRRLLVSFSQEWFRRFDSWPKDSRRFEDLPDLPDLTGYLVTGVFPGTHNDLLGRLGTEIAMRKKLVADPENAARIIEQNWTARQMEVSPEFLLLWLKLDPAGMRKWAESKPKHTDDTWLAKCILFQQVDEETRRKWLNDVPAEEKDRALSELACWDPESAMEEALRINEPVLIGQVFESCTNDSAPSNATHAGFDFLSRFDLSKLPKEVLESRSVTEWPTYVLEDWAEVDIGGCARFGIRCLKQSPWANWEDLRIFFSGGEMKSDAGSVLDRTFSALRVWAVVRPAEMKAWIATEPDPELRKALTWLLEHPWGGNSEP